MKISDRPESKFYNIGWTTVKNVPSLCRHNPHLEMLVMNYPTLDASQKQQVTEMIMAAIRELDGQPSKTFHRSAVIIRFSKAAGDGNDHGSDQGSHGHG